MGVQVILCAAIQRMVNLNGDVLDAEVAGRDLAKAAEQRVMSVVRIVTVDKDVRAERIVSLRRGPDMNVEIKTTPSSASILLQRLYTSICLGTPSSRM